jgi:AhpD family alkylhydroperoxidase
MLQTTRNGERGLASAEANSRLRPHGPDFEELAPDAYRAMVGIEGALSLEPRLRELVEVRTAQLTGAPESLARHAREALELGESQSRLAGLAGWRNASRFGEDERAALGLAEALVLAADHRTIAEARNKAAKQFDPAELAQLAFVSIAAAAWDRLELATGATRP